MGLETGTYINDLVPANPTASDLVSQGDDHLRLIKTVLKNTFPNAASVFSFPATASVTSSASIASSARNTTHLIDTTSGIVTVTLPTLIISDAGWECSFLKISADTNPLLIAPASGTIQSGNLSGLAKTRRCIPGARTRVLWTGFAWVAERAIGPPVGAILDFDGGALPVGYEWPSGQTLSSAANYPDYFAAKGSGVTRDLRGFVAAGRDDMGGTAAGRITIISGTTLGVAGGEQVHTLAYSEMPSHTHNISAFDSGHTHPYTKAQNVNTTPVGGGPVFGAAAGDNTGVGYANISASADYQGGGSYHNNLQPTMILNKILVVE